MAETPKPVDHPAHAPAKRRKRLDIIIGVVFLILCLILLKSLLGQLSLKHELSAAKTVTNTTITSIQKHDGTKVQALGNKTFQSQNTAANLTAQFITAGKYTTSGPIIDRQTVTNDKNGQAVSVIYKFPKQPVFYIRVIVLKSKGGSTFQLANLKANTSEASLLDNKY